MVLVMLVLMLLLAALCRAQVQPVSQFVQAQLGAGDAGAAGDHFGNALAASGTLLVVGASRTTVASNATRGAAYVFSCTASACTPPGSVLTASDGAAGDFFGVSVAVAGPLVVVGAFGAEVSGAQQGVAYVFQCPTATSCVQGSELTSNYGAGTSHFGGAVAISATLVVIGASGTTVGANTYQGAVFLFSCTSAVLCTQGSVLTASNGAAGDSFGTSVAASGSLVVVGADARAVGSNPYQGAVYVFACGNATTCTQTLQLTASNGVSAMFFGSAVAMSGSVLVVGAAAKTVGANARQGSAYVFACANATSCTQGSILVAGNGAANDDFGVSVAVSGSLVAVGAYGKSVCSPSQGAVFLYVCASASSCTQGSELTASNGATSDSFGASVALSGSLVAVGADTKTVGVNATQGAAYVYAVDAALGLGNCTAGWSGANCGTCASSACPLSGLPVCSFQSHFVQDSVSAGNGAAGDLFGASAAASGSLVVVGAVNKTLGTGAAYVFVCANATSCAQGSQLAASDGAAGDQFGASVAASGSLVVIGAAAKGAAYVFACTGAASCAQGSILVASDGTPGLGLARRHRRCAKRCRASVLDGAAGDLFGASVAAAGSLVVVGASNKTLGTGAAYAFVCANASSCAQGSELIASDGAPGDLFGASVAASGSLVVVGAYAKATGQGAAYVFSCTSAAVCTQGSELVASGGAAAGDHFGVSVAISGTVLVVGASSKAVGTSSSQGAAFVFSCPTATLCTQGSELTAVDGAAGDYFGGSVALSSSGTLAFVGAPYKNAHEGGAYAYAIGAAGLGGCASGWTGAECDACVSGYTGLNCSVILCPQSGTFWNGTLCASCSLPCASCFGSASSCTSCPATGTPYLQGPTCVAACTSPTPLLMGLTCTAACSGATPYVQNSTCVASCSGSTPYLQGTSCVASCTSPTPYVQGTTCVAACSSPTPLLESDVCVSVCSNNLYYQYAGQCVLACPAGTTATRVDGVNVCQIQIVTTVYYYAPLFYDDSSLLEVQLQIFDLGASPATLVDYLNMARCPTAPLFFVDVPATDTQVAPLGFNLVAYTSPSSFITDAANCSVADAYYTGISLNVSANAILSPSACGGSVVSNFTFALDGRAVSCYPTACQGYDDAAGFTQWPNASVSAARVNGTCDAGYGGSPSQLCTTSGWTARQGQCVQCPANCVACSLGANLTCTECAAAYVLSGGACALPDSQTSSIYILLGAAAGAAVVLDAFFFLFYRHHVQSPLRYVYLWTGLARVPLLFAGVFDTISDAFFVVVVSQTADAQGYYAAALAFTIAPYVINLAVALLVGIRCAYDATNRVEQASWFGVVLFTFLSGDVVSSISLGQSLLAVHVNAADSRPGRLGSYVAVFGSNALAAAVSLFAIQFLLKDVPHLVIQASFLAFQAETNPIVVLALAATILTTAVGLFSFLFFALVPLVQGHSIGSKSSEMKLEILSRQ